MQSPLQEGFAFAVEVVRRLEVSPVLLRHLDLEAHPFRDLLEIPLELLLVPQAGVDLQDVLVPSEAEQPSHVPVMPGLDAQHLPHLRGEGLLGRGGVAGIRIVEFVPVRDHGGECVEVAHVLLLHLVVLRTAGDVYPHAVVAEAAVAVMERG